MEEKSVRQQFLQVASNSIFISSILLLLQVVFWALFYYFITQKLHGMSFGVVRFALLVLAASFIIYVVMRCTNPSYQIAWLILLSVAPVMAFIMYLVVRLIPGTAHLAAKVLEKEQLTSLHLVNDEIEQHDALLYNSKYKGLFQYLSSHCHFPTYYTRAVTYYAQGEEVLEAMLEDIAQAESFIFMEYFILDRGALWDRLFPLLQKKVTEGVEVRLMYDGLCDVKLPKNFHEYVNETGIQCRVFSPLRPILSSYQNNRDHRKMTIIDGKIAYTGGVNLADEYANIKQRFGHWKDCGIRFTGNAVQSMTAMFLQMWGLGQLHTDAYCHYMAIDEGEKSAYRYIAPYSDAPENNHDTAENVYCQILDLAESYVHIMSPYLILDERTKKSLCFAAQRGVDVKLLLPHIPDKKIVFYVARSNYIELMRAGVKIYEYTPGFMHAKVFVSDDIISTVGSVNLDFRSLFLHFENGVLLYDVETATTIEEDFQETLKMSECMTIAKYQKLPLWQRTFGHLAKIFGPLM